MTETMHILMTGKLHSYNVDDDNDVDADNDHLH
jgi:hypothetical protein